MSRCARYQVLEYERLVECDRTHGKAAAEAVLAPHRAEVRAHRERARTSKSLLFRGRHDRAAKAVSKKNKDVKRLAAAQKQTVVDALKSCEATVRLVDAAFEAREAPTECVDGAA